MADTQISNELRDYMEKNHLDPANHYATALVLMRLEQKIDNLK